LVPQTAVLEGFKVVKWNASCSKTTSNFTIKWEEWGEEEEMKTLQIL
jgi:hypothetical protein